MQSLERMAEKTGGDFFHASKTEDFDDYFEKVNRQIMNIYLLSYTIYGVKGDGDSHNLGIKITTDYDTVHQLTESVTLPIVDQVMESEKDDESLWWIITAIVAILVIIVVIVIISKKNKAKRKAEEAKRLREFEAEKERELAAERKKAEELQEKLKQKEEEAKKGEIKEESTPKPKLSAEDRERTMIIGGQKPKVMPSGSDSLRMELMFGSQRGKIYTIGKEGATIGRKEDNSIVLSDQTVSSYHAKISYIDGVFIIEDLGSTNGMYINGNRVQIHRIEDSCTFKFGEAEGDFELR